MRWDDSRPGLVGTGFVCENSGGDGNRVLSIDIAAAAVDVDFHFVNHCYGG